MPDHPPHPAAPHLPQPPVLLWHENDQRDLMVEMLGRFALEVQAVQAGAPIPGSYFGESEAGLLGNRLYLRDDTPLHSALHEACHYICMDEHRRSVLDTDAGGEYAEEDAVCYLQILLADWIPGCGRARMWADMDAWGYTFRLGSARAWFEGDAAEARDWLRDHGLIDDREHPTWRVRHG